MSIDFRKAAAYVGLGGVGLTGAGAAGHQALTNVRDQVTSKVSHAAPAKPGTASGEGVRFTLRSVDTSNPTRFVDDMKLGPNACRLDIRNAAKGYVLPDKKCTPGAIDPSVRQSNIDSTICKAGYTKTIRPSTTRAKTAAYRAYGMSTTTYPKRLTEYDHLVSLQLGGASSSSNMFPEPNEAGAKGSTNPKDAVENALNALVCARAVPLAAAQQAIVDNWMTAVTSLGFHAKVIRGSSKLCNDAGTCYPARRPAADTD